MYSSGARASLWKMAFRYVYTQHYYRLEKPLLPVPVFTVPTRDRYISFVGCNRERDWLPSFTCISQSSGPKRSDATRELFRNFPGRVSTESHYDSRNTNDFSYRKTYKRVLQLDPLNCRFRANRKWTKYLLFHSMCTLPPLRY